jgi:hypothetical protein
MTKIYPSPKPGKGNFYNYYAPQTCPKCGRLHCYKIKELNIGGELQCIESVKNSDLTSK